MTKADLIKELDYTKAIVVAKNREIERLQDGILRQQEEIRALQSEISVYSRHLTLMERMYPESPYNPPF